mgnify:FL=1
MAMNSSSMASSIISALSGCKDPGDANNKFYKALCDYVEGNAEVYYSWSATTPPPSSSPDPMVTLKCTIKTSGSLSPSGETTPEGALAKFSADLNSNASRWQVVWPSGFSISPALIIPTINVTPSMKDNQKDAWESVCQEIINGLKMATPGPLPGTHGGFSIPTPGAIFTQIL